MKSVDKGRVVRTRWEVYLPPTPLRWTLSPTLRPKTSGGSPKTTKPNHLPGRGASKPRTPSPAESFVILGYFGELVGLGSEDLAGGLAEGSSGGG